MRSLVIAAISAAALVLGACSTTPEQPGAAGGDPSKPGATGPGGVQTKPIARVDVTGKPGATPGPAALKDPGSPLSRRSIYYALDQYDITGEYRPLIEAHAKYLRENPSARVLVQGNTDERGSREYNVALGQRRSDGVKKMLVLLGARESQIESVSLGEEKPQADGHSEEAWSKNRRSDILYSGEY
jgi:peptidoglycan-associated lipoprotein